MITRLRLVHFKGFKNFTVNFSQDAVLVGPNNAGKSTIISALRLCASAIRVASRLKASENCNDEGRWVRGYPLRLALSSAFVSENVRYEFQDKLTRVDLHFSNRAAVHIVWPTDVDDFFWLEHPVGMQVTTAAKARAVFHSIGLIPTLTPVDHEEKRLSDEHLRSSVDTRLASRHFRNQLSLLQDTCENHRLALPNKVFEYVAAGVPVVASDLPELAAKPAKERYSVVKPITPFKA